MNTPKQQKPFFLYIIISILAVAVIGLGGLALYSLNGLASLQSKVTELQDTVQEMAETSANLVAKSDELKQLQEQISSRLPIQFLLNLQVRKKERFPHPTPPRRSPLRLQRMKV